MLTEAKMPKIEQNISDSFTAGRPSTEVPLLASVV
jgi:hypothetical protein